MALEKIQLKKGNTSATTYTDSKIDSLLATKVSTSDLLNLVYPVGAIYISTTATSPATLFGGSWTKISGKFLLSSSTSHTLGTEGGSEKHHHFYTLKYYSFWENMAAYRYSDNKILVASYSTQNIKTYNAPSYTGVQASNCYVDINAGEGRKSVTANEYTADGDTSYESNMPPYLVVNMWKRTA